MVSNDKFYEVCKQMEVINESFPLLRLQISNPQLFKVYYGALLNSGVEVEKVVQYYLMSTKFILETSGLPFEMQKIIRTASDFPLIIQIVFEFKQGIYTDISNHYVTKAEAPYYLAKAKDLFYPDWMVIQEDFGVSKDELLEKWYRLFIEDITSKLNNQIEKELSELEQELTLRIKRIYEK
ncbi:hypothetical protein [Bacillus toyonensis]|uniref:hypothetical protein n=1 Tax=Bacillus toyonensis TaxID=155322 RepID=UPI002E1C16D7|nr:hypothetical protein [Bacillus toyonensis]